MTQAETGRTTEKTLRENEQGNTQNTMNDATQNIARDTPQNSAKPVPALGSLNKTELDQNIRPQDDLFRHVNGKWLRETEIPADKSQYGVFVTLAEKAEDACRDIILEQAEKYREKTVNPAATAAKPDSDGWKLATLYDNFMNEKRQQTLGATELAPTIQKIREAKSTAALLHTLAHRAKHGGPGLLGAGVDTDPENPSRYLLWFTQGGLGLPDESYYKDADKKEIREKYITHIQKMLTLADKHGAAIFPGETDTARETSAKKLAQQTFKLETEIASAHWNRVRCREINEIYNPHTNKQLQQLAPNFDWPLYLETLEIKPAQITENIVCQPDAIAHTLKLFTPERLEQWRAWLIWHTLANTAAMLNPEIAQENFNFYGTTLSGQPKQRDRWRRAVSFVQGAMGEAIGRIYVTKHFTKNAKHKIDELVAKLLDAYRDSITTLEWMTPATRERALEKLAQFTPKVGYPKKWCDYSTLQISSHSLLQNFENINLFHHKRELQKLDGEIDRDEWFMTPQTVNAYYNPGFNEIVFPAAILQPPFFDPQADPALNYGAIGAVIGHEIGHGFDDQGSQYNGSGKLDNWWQQADREAFTARTKTLIKQYDELSPEGADGAHVNGQLTIGENIGDLGGLGIAWRAYLLSLAGNEPPIIAGLTGAERFFMSWARAWRLKARPESVKLHLQTDPHSPAEFRCNQIVKNLDAFHECFKTTPEDALWLPANERVTIW